METQMAENKMKRVLHTAKGEQSRARIEQWRKIAAMEARKNPNLSVSQIANVIQRSQAGRKGNGRLTYSIDFISRSIRTAACP